MNVKIFTESPHFTFLSPGHGLTSALELRVYVIGKTGGHLEFSLLPRISSRLVTDFTALNLNNYVVKNIKYRIAWNFQRWKYYFVDRRSENNHKKFLPWYLKFITESRHAWKKILSAKLLLAEFSKTTKYLPLKNLG